MMICEREEREKMLYGGAKMSLKRAPIKDDPIERHKNFEAASSKSKEIIKLSH